MSQIDYQALSDTTFLVNGQPLTAQRYTVNGEPWVRYQGAKPSTSGEPLYVNSNGNSYFFETYGPEGGYQEYEYLPAHGSQEDLQNQNKSREMHTRAYGNDKKVEQQQFGGNMNYTSYLQGGGSMVQALIEKVMQSQGQDQSALQQLVELAKEGNEEAIAFLQELQGQSASMKCGGRVKKKQLGEKIMKAKKASCGCQLQRIGGRLIEVDGCTGLPIHRNGAKIQKYWFGGNFIRGLGDYVGSVAGNAAEKIQSGWGHLQRGIGTAAQAVTGGERGNGFVRRGQEDIDRAQATGAKVNSAIDNFSQKAGNSYDDVERAVRTFVPGIGWVLNAADSYMDKKVGNYDATTGNMVTSDGQVRTVVTPRYEDQQAASEEQLRAAVPVQVAAPTATVGGGVPNAEPIDKMRVAAPAPTGRYAKYGVNYRNVDGQGIVEDWANTPVSNKDVRRAVIADNRAQYIDNRAAIRNSGMSFAEQQAMLRAQRQARRQANQDVRDWSRNQQGAYDEARSAQAKSNMVNYNYNGGQLNYTNYLK